MKAYPLVVTVLLILGVSTLKVVPLEAGSLQFTDEDIRTNIRLDIKIKLVLNKTYY